MSSFKVYLLLLSLLVINFSFQEKSRFGLADAARPISLQSQNSKFSSSVEYLKIFKTLGMVCKCCDGVDSREGRKQDLCSATWAGSCSNLQCFPWKFK
ncbi:hypothetical protein A4A49_00712 [Nicotiana attenuata]|uniref:Uncharacterized protein n=1 Tax=Nicotiana attenuata TaxID=49451 RepID=A0A314LBQ8_NICAT|nr:hypothetical protein A4A49_00712 [Nicotiana attenuata]